MASRIALLRDSEAPDYPAAMRDVASHCIHGVDRNPMAVELAKVALWIETVEPGKPLTFLDGNIRCGDSLIGVFDIEMLERAFPTRRTSRSRVTTRKSPEPMAATIGNSEMEKLQRAF